MLLCNCDSISFWRDSNERYNTSSSSCLLDWCIICPATPPTVGSANARTSFFQTITVMHCICVGKKHNICLRQCGNQVIKHFSFTSPPGCYPKMNTRIDTAAHNIVCGITWAIGTNIYRKTIGRIIQCKNIVHFARITASSLYTGTTTATAGNTVLFSAFFSKNFNKSCRSSGVYNIGICNNCTWNPKKKYLHHN